MVILPLGKLALNRGQRGAGYGWSGDGWPKGGCRGAGDAVETVGQREALRGAGDGWPGDGWPKGGCRGAGDAVKTVGQREALRGAGDGWPNPET